MSHIYSDFFPIGSPSHLPAVLSFTPACFALWTWGGSGCVRWRSAQPPKMILGWNWCCVRPWTNRSCDWDVWLNFSRSTTKKGRSRKPVPSAPTVPLRCGINKRCEKSQTYFLFPTFLRLFFLSCERFFILKRGISCCFWGKYGALLMSVTWL